MLAKSVLPFHRVAFIVLVLHATSVRMEPFIVGQGLVSHAVQAVKPVQI